MIINLHHKGEQYGCDLSKPLDISIPAGRARCFYAHEYKATPYQTGAFVGSVAAGAPVNFFEVQMNPHGHGTHTECLGHITAQHESILSQMRQFHFVAELITVAVDEKGASDRVISRKSLKKALPAIQTKAIVIRTLPNTDDKSRMDYSGTNPPYLDQKAMDYLVQNNVRHLLLDLPSVDREEDEGKLMSHHLFWNVEDQSAKNDSRADCTITEMIYVPDEIKDGLYLLNIQIAPIDLDASPSKPILYRLTQLKP